MIIVTVYHTVFNGMFSVKSPTENMTSRWVMDADGEADAIEKVMANRRFISGRITGVEAKHIGLFSDFLESAMDDVAVHEEIAREDATKEATS